MNRYLVFALTGILGLGLGATLSSRPALASQTTLYGTVSDRFLSGEVPMKVSLKNPKTNAVVATRSVNAYVTDGRYLAELEGDIPSGLYVVDIATPDGAPLQSATFVELQSSSPGAKQTGNINISGNLLAGKIGVPTVNAGAMINAIGTGGVSGLRGQSDGTGVLGSTTSTAGAGISGNATAVTGSSSGVIGFNSSPDGFGIRGNGGPGVGVRGVTISTTGPAVKGDGLGLGGLFVSSADGSAGVKGEAVGVKSRGVVGTGEFGVVGSGTITGVSGDGFIGVNGLGTSIGGTFEATGDEAIGVQASTASQFGVSVDARSTGPTSTGVFGSGSKFGGNFASSGEDSAAVFGDGRGTGLVFGGDFGSNSTEGRGVRGKASATSGATFGGWFTSVSPGGTGAIGTVNSETGSTVGLLGTVNSSAGKGIFGEATSTIGVTFGGDFVSNSNKGSGIRARSTATSGLTRAGEFIVSSPTGNGVLASAISSTGNPIAVQGTSAASGGAVAVFSGSSATGGVIGVRTQVASPDGRAMTAQNLSLNSNVEIAGKNGALMFDKGHINKKFGATLFTMSPIAYGVVNANGTKAGGTSNWTVQQSQSATKAYFIHLTGDSLIENNFVCQVTQVANAVNDPRLLPVTLFDTQDPTTFTVDWETTGGAFASTKFQFVVYGQVPIPAIPPTGP